MDETAITLCKENDIPIVVFNVFTPGNIIRAFGGKESVGTLVSQACGIPLETAQEVQQTLETMEAAAGSMRSEAVLAGSQAPGSVSDLD